MRGLNYLEAYGKSLQAAARWEAITESIKDEQERYAALQKHILDQSKVVADLEETFRVKQSNDMVGTKLLAEKLADEKDLYRRTVKTDVARADASKVPKEVMEARERGDKGGMVSAALKVVGKASVPQETVDATLAALRTAGANPQDILGIQNLARSVKDRKEIKGPTADVEKLREFKVAFDVLDAQAESGYAGGVEASVRAENRTDEENALLQKYLGSLGDGTVTADEFGGDEEALFKARAVYNQAQSEQSYTRGQAKFFQPSWLDAQARLAQAQAQLEKAAQSGAIENPQREAARRELLARGLAEEDFQYAHLFGTPAFNYTKEADRIFSQVEGDEVTPVNDLQRRAQAFLNIVENDDWNTDLLHRQFRKFTQNEAELNEMIGYALARDRYVKARIPPRDQLREKKELEAREERKKKAEQALVRKAKREVVAAEVEFAREDEMVAETTSQLRAEQSKAHLAPNEYARYRAMGMSPEEARKKAMRVATPMDTASVSNKAPPVEFKFKPESVVLEAPQAVVDPTDPDFAYRKTPSGDYLVILKGVPQPTPVVKGSRAHASIESVLSGGAALPPKPKPKPAPKPAPGSQFTADPDFEAQGPPAPKKEPDEDEDETEEERLGRLLRQHGAR